MSTAPSGNVLALTVLPAEAEAFAPYGRLLERGEQAALGRRGGVLTSLCPVRPRPLRVTHLQRHPVARRLVLPLDGLSLLVVVLAAESAESGGPAAFRIAPGTGVLIDAGVWHAEPLPLADGQVCEILETRGRVDHLDQRPVADLLEVEEIRVQLPGAPEEPEPALDLETEGALQVEEGLEKSVSLGLLLLDGLDVAAASRQLEEATRATADGLRALAGPTQRLGSILGLAPIRRLWRSWALPRSVRSPYETLLREVLAGHAVPTPDSLRGAVALCSLRRQVVLCAYDAASLHGPLRLRTGRDPQAQADEGEGQPAWEAAAAPVLWDRDGPFAGALGEASRARVGPGVHRSLVVVYLPSGTERDETLAHLREASRAVQEFCGGRETGRLVI